MRARKKRASRLQTHRAALELVAEHGLGGVTVEMIAERAGISPRTFFNHWATKEAALLGVVFTDPDEIGDALRARPLDEPAPVALRAVLRDWMAAMPHDQDLRDLRKRVMAKEPSLHAMNAGRTVQLQGGLVAALEERLSGEDVHARAVIDVQIAFALTRSAFILSMASGTPLDQEFERVLELFDTGAALV
nr:TetR/AcrR family transcriptional regulator [Brachybacterium muris]